MRLRTLIVPGATAMALSLTVLTPAFAGATTSADYKAKVVDLVNTKRAANGCQPLRIRAPLSIAAQQHSDAMAAAQALSHQVAGEPPLSDRVSATGYPWSMVGENIAQAYSTPRSVVKAWMQSPPHRANILNCAFKHIGIGLTHGDGGPWWTQDFGRKL